MERDDLITVKIGLNRKKNVYCTEWKQLELVSTFLFLRFGVTTAISDDVKV